MSIDAWYFSTTSRKLRHGDGRKIALGVTHTVNGPLKLCQFGLHASKCALAAQLYAPGPVLWKVRMSGNILRGDDKMCASARTYVAGGVNVSSDLLKFGRACVLEAGIPANAPQSMVDYLNTGSCAALEQSIEDVRDAIDFDGSDEEFSPYIALTNKKYPVTTRAFLTAWHSRQLLPHLSQRKAMLRWQEKLLENILTEAIATRQEKS